MSGTEDKTKSNSHEIMGKEEVKVGKLTWEGEAIETLINASLADWGGRLGDIQGCAL